MSRQNITSPIGILIAGVVVILFLLAGVGTSAVGRLQTAAPTLTPCLPGDDIYESCPSKIRPSDLTATADAKTATAEAYPYPAGGATPSATPTAGRAGNNHAHAEPDRYADAARRRGAQPHPDHDSAR